MNTKIITISREFGSGGRSIGKAIAKQLDIPYYDKELVKQVALETKFDEKYIEDAGEYSPGATSLSYWLPFTGSDGFMGGLSPASFLWVMQRKVILDIAEKGPCVIVGRCADFILKDRDDCFHVFVHADMDFKADRIVRLYGQTEKTPEERLSEKDKKRSINYKHFTGREWGKSQNYHLSLNSGKIGIDACVETVIRLAAEVK